MYMCDTSFKDFLRPECLEAVDSQGFVREVMHRRIRTGYVCTSMKYLCRRTQKSEEGRTQTAAQHTRKSPKGIAAKENKREEVKMTEGTEDTELYL